MNAKLVEAVLIARYNPTNFKALYGRIPASTTYTKDFIQIPAAVSNRLKPLLGSGNDRISITYVWPGGEQSGHLAWSTDRYHLKWDTNSPPRPWRVGDTTVDPVASISGIPNAKDETEADAVLQAIVDSNSKPWLIAVKLRGEVNRLHLRVYFENPPLDRLDRGLERLPAVVRDLVSRMTDSSGTDLLDLSNSAPLSSTSIRAKALVDKILSALQTEPNVLLVGPPGTGKSVALEDLGNIYASSSKLGSLMFDPGVWGTAWSTAEETVKCDFLVFHPSYTYENFVAGLFPTTNGGTMVLEAKPGPLLCLSHWAGGSTERKALLVVDEFNRGHAAAIFGDTLSLLDKDKRSSFGHPGVRIPRPYPGHKMPVPLSYSRSTGDSNEEVEPLVHLPDTVHIVAAMNSSDRSVAPLDAAMRRRFSVIRVAPDYELLAENLGLDPALWKSYYLPTSLNLDDWTVTDLAALTTKLLFGLNERLFFALGEDFLLGHALLWGLTTKSHELRLDQLARAIDAKVIPTLRMTFVDQDEALAAVLNVPDARTDGESHVAYWRDAPPSLGAFSTRRLTIQLLQAMLPVHQLAAVRELAVT